MTKIDKKILFTLITATAIVGIPATAKAQYYNYYPTYPSYPSIGTTNYPNLVHQPSYQERIEAQDRRHQQFIDSIYY